MAESAGDFFASLKLLVDESSFSQGITKLGSLADSLKGLVVAGAGLLGIKATLEGMISSVKAQTELLNTARYLQMSAEMLRDWAAAARLARVDASALTSSMVNITDIWRKVGEGQAPPVDFLKRLGLMDIDIEKFKDQDPDQMMRTIFNAAQAMKDQGQAELYLKEQLGAGASGLYAYMQRNKLTIDQLLAQANGTQYTTDASMARGASGFDELSGTQTRVSSMFDELSNQVMGYLGDELKKLNTWMDANKENITKMIDAMSKLAGAIIQLLGSALMTSLDILIASQAAANAPYGSTDQLKASLNLAKSAGEATGWMVPKAVSTDNAANMEMYTALADKGVLQDYMYLTTAPASRAYQDSMTKFSNAVTGIFGAKPVQTLSEQMATRYGHAPSDSELRQRLEVVIKTDPGLQAMVKYGQLKIGDSVQQ